MSPQPSNRQALLEGALRCLMRMPLEDISARTVAGEAGANIASINYHFGSKDQLVTAAVVEGLDRWLARLEQRLAELPAAPAGAERFRQAAESIDATRDDNEGIARAFVVALARGHHDEVVANHLTEGFLRTRPRIAALLGLGDDEVGTDAGAVVHAMFVGLIAQALLSPDLALDSVRTAAALQRLASVLTTDLT